MFRLFGAALLSVTVCLNPAEVQADSVYPLLGKIQVAQNEAVENLLRKLREKNRGANASAGTAREYSETDPVFADKARKYSEEDRLAICWTWQQQIDENPLFSGNGGRDLSPEQKTERALMKRKALDEKVSQMWKELKASDPTSGMMDVLQGVLSTLPQAAMEMTRRGLDMEAEKKIPDARELRERFKHLGQSNQAHDDELSRRLEQQRRAIRETRKRMQNQLSDKETEEKIQETQKRRMRKFQEFRDEFEAKDRYKMTPELRAKLEQGALSAARNEEMVIKMLMARFGCEFLLKRHRAREKSGPGDDTEVREKKGPSDDTEVRDDGWREMN